MFLKKNVTKSQEFFERIINTIREPLITLDQNLRVVSANSAFYEVFKVKPQETIGQLVYDLGNKQWNSPKLRELLENILPGKAREELKQLTIELEHASQVKSDFFDKISHELRTTLTTILGFSEVLYDDTVGPLNEKQKKYISNVLTSSKHLLFLINQILDMAKVEAGKMRLTLAILPMKSLLHEISLPEGCVAGGKKLQMIREIAEDLPDIEADELKIKEVLSNLLSNAVKHTPEGGTIGLRAKRIDSEIEIEIWDTGIGIEAGNILKVFDLFFRVNTKLSGTAEGTGLSLPLTRKLVELHGGKLSVESAGLNKGITVRITLPVKSGKTV